MLNTVTISPTDKAYLSHTADEWNFNGVMRLANGPLINQGNRPILIHSLSALETNAIIVSATLNLVRTESIAASSSWVYEVYLVSRAWVPAVVTWRPYDGSNLWTTLGGDYSTKFAEFTAVCTTHGDTTPAYYTIDLGAAGVAHFNSVMQGGSNYGLEVLDSREPPYASPINDMYLGDGSLTLTYFTPNDSIVDVSN